MNHPPFKKADKLLFENFIQFPRELLNREEYKFNLEKQLPELKGKR